MSENKNLVIAALEKVFGPMVERTKDWHPVLAFGLPALVAVLLIAVVSPFVSTNVLWLVGAVIFMILLAYIVVLVIERGTERVNPRDEPVTQRPCATITHPCRNQTVDRTIRCAGTASGIEADGHLWLAVETYGDKVRIWPKEGELKVDRTHRWTSMVFEDGATEQFSIAVYLVDSVGDQFIREWLVEGRHKGGYDNLIGINGAQRLTRVEGLTLRDLTATQSKIKSG